MNTFMKKVVAFFAAVAAFFTGILGGLLGFKTPRGKQLDLTRFELTFEDNFNGDSLDMDKWGYEWWVTDRKGGFWHEDMTSVKDGNLVIRTEYKDTPLEYKYNWKREGFTDYKPGWYSGEVVTRDKFQQKYGYFECRCILPKGAGIWSAFWMMNDGVVNVNGDGKDGTEIDIFESPYYGEKLMKNAVSSNLHYDGYNADHKQLGAQKFLVNNPYEEFNTYGVEWNQNAYTFYINGVESFTTSYGGVSENPEYLLLSVEVSGENGVCDRKDVIEGDHTDFIIDYVRAYQYKLTPPETK